MQCTNTFVWHKQLSKYIQHISSIFCLWEKFTVPVLDNDPPAVQDHCMIWYSRFESGTADNSNLHYEPTHLKPFSYSIFNYYRIYRFYNILNSCFEPFQFIFSLTPSCYKETVGLKWQCKISEITLGPVSKLSISNHGFVFKIENRRPWDPYGRYFGESIENKMIRQTSLGGS